MKTRILSIAIASSLLAACATAPSGRGAQIADAASTAIESNRTSANESVPYFEVIDRIWVGSTVIDEVRDAQLPEVFDRAVIFRRQVPITLNQAAEYIQSNYGVPVVITTDAQDAAAGVVIDPVQIAARQNAARLAAATTSAQLAAGVPEPGQQQQQMQIQQYNAPTQNGGANERGSFYLAYEGNLKGMLDRVTAATGTSWKYERGRVMVFHVDTRTFSLSLLPGATTVSSTITNQSTGGGAGGGESGSSSATSGGSSASMSATIDQFAAAVETVNSMLSPRGRAVAAQGLNQVTVTDLPAVLDRIEDFIKRTNDIATRQIVLEVQVYAIESSDTNSAGISWDSIWESVEESVALTSAGTADSDSASLSYSILDPGSRFNGSQIIVDALSRHANLQELTSVRQSTMSGQVIPIQTGEEVAYQANVQTTLVPDAGAQTTRTLGRVNTGFSMTALPVITQGDEILLQLQANISTLRELRRIGNEEEGLIEAPLVDSRQTFNRVKLSSGQTLVITGLEQESFRSDLRGVGHPSFQLLGGGTEKAKSKTTIVILVTPRIVS